MPTMTASAGRFLVCSVMRALEPCTTSTSCPCPHPTESSATIARPVLPSAAGSAVAASYLTLSGSTTNNFWPLSVLSFWVATTWPVTRARNMGDLGNWESLREAASGEAAPSRDSSHLGYVIVGSGNHMNADDFAHAPARFRAGIHRGANRSHVTLDRDGHQS